MPHVNSQDRQRAQGSCRNGGICADVDTPALGAETFFRVGGEERGVAERMRRRGGHGGGTEVKGSVRKRKHHQMKAFLCTVFTRCGHTVEVLRTALPSAAMRLLDSLMIPHDDRDRDTPELRQDGCLHESSSKGSLPTALVCYTATETRVPRPIWRRHFPQQRRRALPVKVVFHNAVPDERQRQPHCRSPPRDADLCIPEHFCLSLHDAVCQLSRHREVEREVHGKRNAFCKPAGVPAFSVINRTSSSCSQRVGL